MAFLVIVIMFLSFHCSCSFSLSLSSNPDFPQKIKTSVSLPPPSSVVDDVPTSSFAIPGTPSPSFATDSSPSWPSTKMLTSPLQQSGSHPSFFSKKAIIIAGVIVAIEASVLLLLVTFFVRRRYTHGGRRRRRCTTTGGSRRYLRPTTSLQMTKFHDSDDVEACLHNNNEEVFYGSKVEASRKKNSPSLSLNTDLLEIVIVPATSGLITSVSPLSSSAPPPPLVFKKKTPPPPSQPDAMKTLSLSASPTLPLLTHGAVNDGFSPKPRLNNPPESNYIIEIVIDQYPKDRQEGVSWSSDHSMVELDQSGDSFKVSPTRHGATDSEGGEDYPVVKLNKPPLNYISETGTQEDVSWRNRFLLEDKPDNGGDSFQNTGDMIGVFPTAHVAAGSSTSPPMVKLKPLLHWDKVKVDSRRFIILMKSLEIPREEQALKVDSGRSMMWNKIKHKYCITETNSYSRSKTIFILSQSKSQNTSIILMKSLENIPRVEKLPADQLPVHFLYHHHLLKSITRAKVMLFRINYGNNKILHLRESFQSTCNDEQRSQDRMLIPKAGNKQLIRSTLTDKYSISLVAGLCMKLVPCLVAGFCMYLSMHDQSLLGNRE